MTPAPLSVPSKDYGLQHKPLLPSLMEEIRRVLLEEDPILGASVESFEREFADWAGVRHAVGVNSGTDALVLALRGAGVREGDEVLTAANTFLATVTAVTMAGARPVLVDPDPETMTVDATRFASSITPRTRAIIAVHLYGRLAPMEPIVSLCEERGLLLFEDAAQAHGARSTRAAGSFGRAGCFSFHPSKNLGAFGDAGCVTTDSEELAARLRVLRNLGKSTKYDVTDVAPNSKLDTLQAAILRIKLRHVDSWNARRRALAARYLGGLAGIPGLTPPEDPGGGAHVFHQFVIRTPRRDELRRFLAERGIRAGMHYPIPPHLQPIPCMASYRRGDFPVAEECARTVASLPISHELRDEQIDRVIAAIREFFHA